MSNVERLVAVALIPLLLVQLTPVGVGWVQAEEKEKLAVLDIISTGGADDVVRTLTEVLLSEIDSLGKFDLLGKSEIQAMLGFEKDKMILGCQDDTSCMVELGGALGVEKIVVGSVGRIGTVYVVNLKLIDITKASVEGRIYEKVHGEVEKLLEAIPILVSRLFGLKVVHGTLRVEANVEGAKVRCHGKLHGLTPLEKPLEAGTHKVMVEKEGFETWEKLVVIEKDKTTKLVAELKRAEKAEAPAAAVAPPTPPAVPKPAPKPSVAMPEREAPKAVAAVPKAVTAAPAPPAPRRAERPTPWYKKWWVWTIVGVVATGGAVAAVSMGGGGAGEEEQDISLVFGPGSIPDPTQ